MKIDFFEIFRKNTEISKFMKIPPMKDAFVPNRPKDGPSDMKLIVAFHYFTKAPNNVPVYWSLTCFPSLAQKVAGVLSETHRQKTSPSSDSDSWNQIFNRPFTLLVFVVDISPYKAQKRDCKRGKNGGKQSRKSKLRWIKLIFKLDLKLGEKEFVLENVTSCHVNLGVHHFY
jgi:hypothetical protein